MSKSTCDTTTAINRMETLNYFSVTEKFISLNFEIQGVLWKGRWDSGSCRVSKL